MKVKFALKNGNYFFADVDGWKEAQKINQKSFLGQAVMTKEKESVK